MGKTWKSTNWVHVLEHRQQKRERAELTERNQKQKEDEAHWEEKDRRVLKKIQRREQRDNKMHQKQQRKYQNKAMEQNEREALLKQFHRHSKVSRTQIISSAAPLQRRATQTELIEENINHTLRNQRLHDEVHEARCVDDALKIFSSFKL
eukprot:TRINITY_DN3071_c0_g1_i1.p1 TRINITY_DN3071_c0_g1~~TRINITY_DN3071_c0_g1_i1.p1  ORF type:complete len:150 (+),score=46.20 TRINITY_DN3071_c0_g1_i1:148-597(+)